MRERRRPLPELEQAKLVSKLAKLVSMLVAPRLTARNINPQGAEGGM